MRRLISPTARVPAPVVADPCATDPGATDPGATDPRLVGPWVMRTLSLAIFACAGLAFCGSIQLLRAQAQTAAEDRGQPASLQSAGAYPFPAPVAAPFALTTAGNSSQWSRSLLEPFEPGPNFGKFRSSAERGVFHYDAGNSFALGVGSRGVAGFNRFSDARIEERRNGPASFFPKSDFLRGSAVVTRAQSGAGPRGAPTLNELMRAGVNQRTGQSLGSLPRANPVMFPPGGTFTDSIQTPISSMFITSDLGNGVLFSAGASNAGHSMAGAPAAGLGSSPGTKHAAASVGLKLSF